MSLAGSESAVSQVKSSNESSGAAAGGRGRNAGQKKAAARGGTAGLPARGPAQHYGTPAAAG